MAGVGVVVVFRQQVNVVEEDATPVFISEGLPHPHVQQLGSVKRAITPLEPETEDEGDVTQRGLIIQCRLKECIVTHFCHHPANTHMHKNTCTESDLVHDVDAVVDLLSLQKGVKVVEERPEVGLPVPVRHHNSCVVTRFTVRRSVTSAWQH